MRSQAIYMLSEFTSAGGDYYATNLRGVSARSGPYTGRIIHGAKTAIWPAMQKTRLG